MNPIPNVELKALALAITFGLGVWAGVVWNTPKPHIEPPAPAVIHKDGSQLLARVDPASPAAQAVAPPPTVDAPAGMRLARSDSVTVECKRATGGGNTGQDASAQPAQPDAADGGVATITLDEFQDKNGNTRVLARSADGIITGGLDIPRLPALVQPAHNWAAGFTRSVIAQQVEQGVDVEHDSGPLRLGVQVLKVEGESRPEVLASVLWRF